jgi:HAE1 family hydrophobic/amphiphilic exporter-1
VSARSAVGGQQKPSVRVQVDPGKIAALGIQLEDIAGVMDDRHGRCPQGLDQRPLRSFAIYDNDQLNKAAPWNDVVVAYKNGAPVRIRDIGVAWTRRRTTSRSPGRTASRHPAADLQAAGRQRHRDHRARACAAAQSMLSVPPSIKVEQIADRTTTIKASVRDVEFTLMLTIALVVMVIFLFLRNVWATIIPGVTVPLSLLRHRGADVRHRLQPRQPLADGPDDRGGLRGR